MFSNEHEKLSEILNRTIGWTENYDGKASTVLASVGVIAGVLLATDYVKKIVDIYRFMADNPNFWSVMYLIACVVAIGTMIVGCLNLIGVLKARIGRSDYTARGVRGGSLIFFASIAKHKTLDAYKAKLENCSDEQLIDDMIAQIYICSVICQKKFNLYKKGLNCTLVGFFAFSVLTIIGVLVA